MKCKKCGAVLTDSDIFCNECGARVELIAEPEAVAAETHITGASKCPKCGAALTDSDLFCNECGARVELTEKHEVIEAELHATCVSKCQKCGADLAGNDLFCNECGARVELMTEPEVVEAETHVTAATPTLGAYFDIDAVTERGTHVELTHGHETAESKPHVTVTQTLDARTKIDAVTNTILCMQCGTKNVADKRFCKSCGASLTARKSTLEPEPGDANVLPAAHDADAPRIDIPQGAGSPEEKLWGPMAAIVTLVFTAGIALFIWFLVFQNQSSSQFTDGSTSVSERSAAVPSPILSTPRSSTEHTSSTEPASYYYYPCSGYVQVDTKDGSLLNIRPAPGAIDPIVFHVPDNSKLRVDGWTWDVEHGSSTYWFRVTDHGGYVLGWVSRNFCVETKVDFRGTVPYSSSWTRTETHRGSNVVRKHDPASYLARYATGHITVTAPNHDLNVRPAPGVVDDVVFIITDKYGCKVNGWSYDQFESGTDRVWLRLTDNHDNILGWVNAGYCDTQYVER